MANYRKGRQVFTTVAALIAYNEIINKPGDTIYITAIQREFVWTAGSTLAGNGSSVIDQTSATLLGRWVATLAVAKTLVGSFSIPSLDNSGVAVVQATVAGLPVGSNITVAATNADVAYAGAVIPETIRYKFVNSVKVANTIEIEVESTSGLDDTTAFTLAVIITVLS